MCVNGLFTCFGDEEGTRDPHDISKIDKMLEGLEARFADGVLLEVHLNGATSVLQDCKERFSMLSFSNEAACDSVLVVSSCFTWLNSRILKRFACCIYWAIDRPGLSTGQS